VIGISTENLKENKMIKIERLPTQKYHFEVKSESGTTLLKSISYDTSKLVKEASSDILKQRSNRIERKTNHNGKFLFSLKNDKGSLIGNSQLYQSEAGMENGIKNLLGRINTLSQTT